MAEGDICLLMYDSKLTKPTYRICRIKRTYPDNKGVVRTVRVQCRPRDARDSTLPYHPKELISQDVPIQRLVLILPKADQGPVQHAQSVAINHVDLVDVVWPLLDCEDSDLLFMQQG